MITRELAEKAMERCATVCEELPGVNGYAAHLIRTDKNYKEALIRVAMECKDIDELDNVTRVYFIEDETEYEAALAEVLENLNKQKKLVERFAEIYTDLDD